VTQRIPLDHLTSDQYDALCDELDALRAISRGYCPECGRGDAAPTVEDWERERHRADEAEAQRDQHAAALTIVQSITAAWYASSEGRDVLIEDLAAAGHPLPEDEPDQPAAKPTKGPGQ
jgi:hypothetical protein